MGIEQGRSLLPQSESEAENSVEHEFEWMPDPEQRRLLGERMMILVDEVQQKQFDNLIFLDRAARPLATLFSDFWEKRFGSIDKPAINFLNIDRRKVDLIQEIANKINPGRINHLVDAAEEDDQVGRTDFDYALESLSNVELLDVFGAAEVRRVRNQYKNLASARRVLIADEISMNGYTLELAERLVKTLFPRIEILESDSLRGGSDNDHLFHDFETRTTNAPWNKEGEVIKEELRLTSHSGIKGNPAMTERVRQLRKEMHALADEYWEVYGHLSYEENVKSVRDAYLKNLYGEQGPPKTKTSS